MDINALSGEFFAAYEELGRYDAAQEDFAEAAAKANDVSVREEANETHALYAQTVTKMNTRLRNIMERVYKYARVHEGENSEIDKVLEKNKQKRPVSSMEAIEVMTALRSIYRDRMMGRRHLIGERDNYR